MNLAKTSCTACNWGYESDTVECKKINCLTHGANGDCTVCNLGYEKNLKGFCSAKNCKFID